MRSSRWLDATLKAEWIAVVAGLVVVYSWLGGSWLTFGVLILLPDLSMLAYLAGPQVGAIGYNAFHTLLGPIGLAAIGSFTGSVLAVQLATIWGVHIAFDRAAGYGLKYASGFGATHLGGIGRVNPRSSPPDTHPRAGPG